MSVFGEVYQPVEDTGNMTYPPGDYPIRIESADIQDTKDGHGQYMMLTNLVLESDLAGRQIIDRINFKNANPVAVEIAKATMQQLAFIMNKPLQDPSDVIGLECVLRITVSKPKNGNPPGNNFKYLPKDSGQGFASQSQNNAPAQSGGGSAPWQKRA